MALVWQKRVDGVRYEVRSAGSSLRLYTNGVLHTQYSTKNLWTGSVWDLLTIGSLLLAPDRVRRILVLGVGGGAAIRQLLAFFPQARITGVELNPVHVQVARSFFGLRDPRVELVCENAVTYLALYDGEPFDIVIDDLFGERGGVPCRAVRADADWLDLLTTHLAPDGMLTVNFADAREAARSPWRKQFRSGVRSSRFTGALSLSTPGCENRVLALLPLAATTTGLRRVLAARMLAMSGTRVAPRYRARRLS